MRVFNRFCNNLGLVHVKLINHVLKYISETLDLSLKFDRKVNTLDDIVRYIFLDFVGLKIDQKLTENYIFILARVVTNHLFKLQLIIILSTYKTKYIAMCKVRKEMVWQRYLLAELEF